MLAWEEPLAASTNGQQCDGDDNLASGTDGTTTARTLKAWERGLVMLVRVLAETTMRALASKVRPAPCGMIDDFEMYNAVGLGSSSGTELEQWTRLNAKAREFARGFQERARGYTQDFEDPVGMWLI